MYGVPNDYCGIGGTGVGCPSGIVLDEEPAAGVATGASSGA